MSAEVCETCGVVAAAPASLGMLQMKRFVKYLYLATETGACINATWQDVLDTVNNQYYEWVRKNKEAGRVLTVVSIEHEEGAAQERPTWWPTYHASITVKYYGDALP